MDIVKRLQELDLEIPEIAEGKFSYIPGRIVGNLVFVSGAIPISDGKLLYQGKLGRTISVEQGYEAARLAALNCVGALQYTLKDLHKVKKIIKLSGYVASAEGFTQQPQVVNGASDLLIEIWGEEGKHARKAIGVFELPMGVPVEIELIAEIE